MFSTGNKKGSFVSGTRRCRFLPFEQATSVHNVAGGAGSAGQADPGVGEREGGAGVAAAGERRPDQGDQELMIVSERKNQQ